MSAGIPQDFRMKYSRGTHEAGGAREQREVEMLDDGEQHPDVGLQEAGPRTLILPPVQKRSCRKATVALTVLCLLMLAGIIILSTFLTLKIIHAETKCDDLQKNCTQLKRQNSAKWCPDRWTRFGSSCYFKSTERKTWSNSRKDCQDKGADLVIINSEEEQKFIHEIMRGESWIGLNTTLDSQSWKWEWVDGSPLTETFRGGLSLPCNDCYGVCCKSDGNLTDSLGYDSGKYVIKSWICEK